MHLKVSYKAGSEWKTGLGQLTSGSLWTSLNAEMMAISQLEEMAGQALGIN